MRKSLIMGTREDVQRMRNRNEASKRSLHVSAKCNDTADCSMSPVTTRHIVTFNHPSIMEK